MHEIATFRKIHSPKIMRDGTLDDTALSSDAAVAQRTAQRSVSQCVALVQYFV